MVVQDPSFFWRKCASVTELARLVNSSLKHCDCISNMTLLGVKLLSLVEQRNNAFVVNV